MKYIDIFNGDADGICALLQLRNAQPESSTLITGVKRDISLVQQALPDIEADTQITVLDISLEKNIAAINQCLEVGANVHYFDHHNPGQIPENKNLIANINTHSEVCTSLLVDQHLQGQYKAWAVTGAFGDNLEKSALAQAKHLDISQSQLAQIQKLGIYLNYNGYGSSLDDLYFSPSELYRQLSHYSSPLIFLQEDKSIFDTLENGYNQDLANVGKIDAEFSSNAVEVYILPGQAWARRISGVFGNQLANNNPDKAHAVLTELDSDAFLVSVRAPLNNKTGADEVCRQFPSGGGRKGAAGINKLAMEQKSLFIEALQKQYKR